MCRLEPGQGMPDGAEIYATQSESIFPPGDGEDCTESDPGHCIECGEVAIDGQGYCPRCWCFDIAFNNDESNPYKLARRLSELTDWPFAKCLDLAWEQSWEAMKVKISDIEWEINKIMEAMK